MRKSRIKIADIDDRIVVDVEEDPDKFFSNLKNLSVSVPSWAKLTLVVLHKPALEISFFEDAKTFFLCYTKKVLRNKNPGSILVCFAYENKEWRSFVPPTLIGTNLKTKVRKKP